MNSQSAQSQDIVSSVASTSERLSSPVPFIPEIIQEELNCILNDLDSEDGDCDFGLGSEEMKVKYGFRDGTPTPNSVESHDPLLRPRSVKNSDLPSKKKNRVIRHIGKKK